MLQRFSENLVPIKQSHTVWAAIATLVIAACLIEKTGTEATSVNTDNGSTTSTTTPAAPTTSGASSGITTGAQVSTSEASEAESSDLSTTGGAEILPCETWNDTCPDGMKCIPYFNGPGQYAWDSQGCFPIVENPAALGDACVYAAPVDGELDTCVKGS